MRMMLIASTLLLGLGTVPAAAATGPSNPSKAPGVMNPHGDLKAECEDCHTAKSWTSLRRPSLFHHASTGFPLEGRHASTDCMACHKSLMFAQVATNCIDCHRDVHAGKSGSRCQDCHTPVSWTDRSSAVAKHSRTGFPLRGMHALVECTRCHVGVGEASQAPLSRDCYPCHATAYAAAANPNHATSGFSTRCETCHDPAQARWGGLGFNHDLTGFPLTGAHQMTVCASCHVGGKFAGTPRDCYACHRATFEATTDPDHQLINLSTKCADCHSTTAWKPGKFDHSTTAFPLTGTHLNTSCSKCHVGGVFQGTPKDCFSCHLTDFNGSTNPNHQAGMLPHTCADCHTTSVWTPSKFDHNRTAFPITGAHALATCQRCHLGGVFKGTAKDCFACHQPEYVATTMPPHSTLNMSHLCADCHTTTAWQPGTFDHSKTAFALTGAHLSTTCGLCHVGGVFKGTPTDCFSCHATAFNATTIPDHETGNFSHVCLDCHTTGAWKPAKFDHSKTAFPLTGAHILTSCALCHVGGVYKGTPKDCFTCHLADYNATTYPNHQATMLSHTCTACHTTAAWKPSSFNHDATAFRLIGAHKLAACEGCHVGGVFLGTPKDCYSCHVTDYNSTTNPDHQTANYSHLCLDCHLTTLTAWKPANFDHSKTRFPLTGAHLLTSCALCHVGGLKDPPMDCFSCHVADYNGTTFPDHQTGMLSQTCTTCHTTSVWKPSTFNHSATAFPLVGAHMLVACEGCHVGGVFKGTPKDCFSCHQTDYNATTIPDHETGLFSHLCLDCHTSAAWKPAKFDHSKTAFPLTGAHILTSCALCHVGGVYKGTPMDCFSCHVADYNGTTFPDHQTGMLSHTCTTCHTTSVWKPSTFNHNATAFPLIGAHTLVACEGCHVGGVFKGTPTTCFSCHVTDFNATTFPDHEVGNFSHLCLDCHTMPAWKPAKFDHSRTAFPLTGAHILTSCVLCHVGGVTKPLPMDCFSCHQTDYNTTTNPPHQASLLSHLCLDCHTTSAWKPAKFDHNKTLFPLTGMHLLATCAQCHVGGVFKGTPKDCYACHQTAYMGTTNPNHQLLGYPPTCATCHMTTGWSPANINHDARYFRIYSGKHAHKWKLCSECHFNSANFKDASCVICHHHNQLKEDERHRNKGVSGYTSDGQGCYRCHARV